MAHWTEKDIPPLAGRTAVVTGANSGLGYHATLQLAAHGARVVLASRDTGKAAAAADEIRRQVPEAMLEMAELDLANLQSVRQFADTFNASHENLDMLINNAGVMAIPQRRTADGFEMQLGTNHLGHFALTGLLLPSLLARPGARVVTVSSNAASRGRINFDDLQSDRKYRSWGAYGQSKLANQLFMLELDRLARQRHIDLISAGAHPGYAATNLQAVGPTMQGSRLMARLMDVLNRLVAQPASRGALPELYAATAPNVVGGEYFGPDGLLNQRGYPTRVPTAKQALDRDVARRLWQVSEELTGVRFELLNAAAA
ncbi:MAG: short-chain dehydrogenase [Chloroflexi bacterium]|nr:short-chain dehydrogenase [Chloroflexota bacterium]MDB5076280.1 short-chain dehydrogenase [Chloroflexota bacterium]